MSENLERPDSTAVRVALWRALHLEVDAPPYVLEDSVGISLIDPPADWRDRGDMNPDFTRPFRASIVARARYIDDLALEQYGSSVKQYVILGSGLDTFAQRKGHLVPNMNIYEVDSPGHIQWKRRRLLEQYGEIADNLRLVGFDFESDEPWWDRLAKEGFDSSLPSLITSLGVSMYLSREAVQRTLESIVKLAPGTIFVMSFLLPLDMADAEVRPGLEASARGAKASGTPFISFFRPNEILELAKEAGFKKAQHISANDLAAKYFSGRSDGLRPPANAEELLVATT